MLDKSGFDLWADGYDRSVVISDEDNSYPFAGYKKVLGGIYKAIREGQGKSVLDIGFGTGVLSCKLYENGYDITGIDFSTRMIQIAQEKMPAARLIQHDFSNGMPPELADSKFDAIICTYAIHHLEDSAKIYFLKELRKYLNAAGRIYIGDIAFDTRDELRICRESCADEWDEDEFYIVAEEIKNSISNVQFEKISNCAGILTLDARTELDIASMKCRIMAENDIDLVVPLYIEYYNACEGGQWTQKTTYKRIHQVWSREDSLCMILELGSEVIGFVMGYFEQYDDIQAYDLVEIVIAHVHQGKGIGTWFMGLIEAKVKESGGSMIQLEAVNDDMHNSFYGKLNYQNCNNLVLKSKWL